ncbi:MAG: bacterial Ig-like domain-containing protein [Lachnospiraceae bacterium]|nr:bacterial Ig-like domain-containing protein [Lachnospiraceae bacterium]
MKKIKRLTAVIISLAMVLGYAPQTAHAAYINTLWDLESETAGEAPSSVTRPSTQTDRGTVTYSVTEDGGLGDSKALCYAVGSPATNSNFQTHTMRVAGGDIPGYALAENDIFWFYLQSQTDVNYRLLAQFRVAGSTVNFTATTIYTLESDGTKTAIDRVNSAAVADDGLALENHASNGSISGIVVGRDFEGWVGIPIVSTDTGLIGKALQAVDFFVRKSGQYSAAVGAGSRLLFDSFTVTSSGLAPTDTIKEVSSIEWITRPSRVTYSVGEALDLTGGSIKVNYTDGTSENMGLTAGMISGFSPVSASAQTLTVSYEGKTLSYDIEVTAVGTYRALIWDPDVQTSDFVFPGNDRDSGASNVGNRGRMDFSVANNGIGGSAAFVMTVAEASTNAGILNGTLNKENWKTAGVTGFEAPHAAVSDDIFWFWADNEMGQDEFIVIEFFSGGSNYGTATATNRTNVLYTVSDGQIVTLAPGSSIGGFTNYNTTTRGALLAADKASGWIGIPLYDIDDLRDNTVEGFRIYTRSYDPANNSLATNGTVGSYIAFDEFWVCSLGLMPDRNAVKVSGIELYSAPDKLVYEAGEALDLTGGAITVTNGSGQVRIPMTAEMISGYEPFTAGEQTVTVSYEDFSVSFTVTVNAAAGEYRHLLWDIDALGSDAVLPDRDSNSKRGAVSLELTDKGLAGSAALAMTVNTTSSDAGILNGIARNWSGVSGFAAPRAVRSSDIFWLWIDNAFSSDQYLHVEFSTETSVNAALEKGAGRTGTLYTITDQDGKAVRTAIPAGESLGGITNDRSDRGVIRLSAGTSGWVGIPLGDVIWGETISGLRIYMRSLEGAANGVVGESVYLDGFWVTDGSLPDLADDVLLNAPAEDPVDEVLAAMKVGSELQTEYLLRLRNAPAEGDRVVMRARLGEGEEQEIDGVLLTEGELAGYYSFNFDHIYQQQMTDVISGAVMLIRADASEETLYELKAEDGHSIADYCTALVTADPSNTQLVTFLADMLRFGAETQRYAGYRTDAPADSAKWVSENVKTYSFEEPPEIVTRFASGPDRILGGNLVIAEKLRLQVRASIPDTDGVSVVISDGNSSRTLPLTDTSIVSLGEDLYDVIIDRLMPHHYGTYYDVSLVRDGSAISSVRYGVYTYLFRKQADAALADIVAAINDYSHAAAEYVAGTGSGQAQAADNTLLADTDSASVWETDQSAFAGKDLISLGYIEKTDDAAANDIKVRMTEHKGYADGIGLGYTLLESGNTTSAKILLKAENLMGSGFASFKPSSEDDLIWFYVNADDMTSDQRLDIKLNGVALKLGASVYTVTGEPGAAAVTEIPYDQTAGAPAAGVAPVANAGTATYTRIKVEDGFAGWVGLRAGDFTRGGSITASTDISEISIQLYQHGSQDTGKKQVGSTMYFSAFRTAKSGCLPVLDASENVLYRPDHSFGVDAVLSDASLFIPKWYTGDDPAELWAAADANWQHVQEKAAVLNDFDRNLLSMAHRGDRWEAYYPENSLESVMSVILYGADAVEVDLRATSDGVIVLMHDATLSRTTNVEEYRAAHPGEVPDSDEISAWTFEQLQLLNLKYYDGHSGLRGKVSPYRIPTLAEVLKAAAGRAYITLDANGVAWMKIRSLISSIPEAADSALLPYGYNIYNSLSTYEAYLTNIGIHFVEANSNNIDQLYDRLAAIEELGVSPVIRPSLYYETVIPDEILTEVEGLAGAYHIYGEKLGGAVGMGLEDTDAAYAYMKSMVEKGYSILMTENTYRLIDFVRDWNAGIDPTYHPAVTVLDFENGWKGASLPLGSSPSADSGGYGFLAQSGGKSIETVSFADAKDESLNSDADGTVLKWQIDETWVGSGDGSVAGLTKCSGAFAYLNTAKQSLAKRDLSSYEAFTAYVDASHAFNSAEIELRLIEKQNGSFVTWDGHSSKGGTGAITVSEYYIQDSTGAWQPGGMFQGRIIVPAGYTGSILLEFDQMATSASGITSMSRSEVDYIAIGIRGTAGDTVYVDDLGAVAEKVSENCRQSFRLTSLFGDGMIFQQNSPVCIKGYGIPGRNVTVDLINNDSSASVGQASATVSADGTWSVLLDPVSGSYTSYTLTASCGDETKTVKNVVFGEVWITGGQSNMQLRVQETDGWSALYAGDWKNSNIRIYRQQTAGATVLAGGIPTEPYGAWGTGESWTDVYACSSIGYYWAVRMQEKLGVPVGIVNSAVGGTSISVWVDNAVADEEKYSDYKALLNSLGYYTNTGTLVYAGNYFDTRIAPFAGYEAKGILWYQGEHDRGDAQIQEIGIAPLVDSWSRVFNSDGREKLMPIVAMQVAPYATLTSDASMSFHYNLNSKIRTGLEMLKAAGGSGAAVPTYDFNVIVDNIHPTNKQEVALRAALTAMQLVYDSTANGSGPRVSSVSYDEEHGKVTLTFDQAGDGLVRTNVGTRGFDNAADSALLPADYNADSLNGFAVWDGLQIVSAAADITGSDEVTVTVPEGCTNVIGVCYGNLNGILSANLYNSKAGYSYPALPFLAEIEGASIGSHSVRLWDGGDAKGVADGTAVGDVSVTAGRTGVSSTVKNGKGLPDEHGTSTKAWAYTLTNVVTSGSNVQANTATFNAGANRIGFNANVTPASGDIVWIHIDTELTGPQSLFIYLNSNQMVTDRIYTIINSGSGAPAIRTLTVGGSYNGIGLDNHGNSGWQKITLEAGASGWVGIPAAAAADTVGNLLSTIQIFTRSYQPTAQTNGDAVYFDELWVTSAGLMPALSDSQLTVGLPETTIHREIIWDLDSLTQGTEDTVTGQVLPGHDTSNTNRGSMSFSIAGEGIMGSNAFAMAVVEPSNANGGGLINGTLNREDWTVTGVSGFTASGTVQSGDIFWVWINNGFSATKYAVIEFTGDGTTNLGGTYVTKSGVTRTQNLYTIVAGEGGLAQIREITPGESFEGLENSISGVGAIKLASGWSGWVGIPLNDLSNSTAVGRSITGLRLYTRSLSATETNGEAGDVIYFDGFCIAESGLLPVGTEQELLYRKN